MIKTLFLGGGAMASALIGGILRDPNQNNALFVVDPDSSRCAALTNAFPGIRCFPKVSSELMANVDLLIFAVKPQQMYVVTQQVQPYITQIPVALSIAAGVRTDTITRWLHGFPRLVRAMPNTPSLVGAGISAVYATADVDDTARQMVNNLLAHVGDVIWLDKEAKIDAMTAISGSGPAYVFYFLESLQDAAVTLGMSAEQARFIALSLVNGSLKLAQFDNRAFTQLRADITSKGGTTEHALNVFDAAGVKKVIGEAITAALARAVELGNVMDASHPPRHE